MVENCFFIFLKNSFRYICKSITKMIDFEMSMAVNS
jgi:hypothetical protein